MKFYIFALFSRYIFHFNFVLTTNANDFIFIALTHIYTHIDIYIDKSIDVGR